MNLLILLFIGYVLGSLSPGYFFGRVVKGIDIRKVGKNKNTGASNTYREVGPIYGVITGIFDALKAATAYFIATKGFLLDPLWINDFASRLSTGINPDFAILVGLAAVAGHIWPFYLQFKGGRGAASLTGLAVITLYYTASWYALALIGGAIIYGLIFNQVKFESRLRKILKLAGIVFPLSTLFVSTEGVLSAVVILLFVFALFDILRFLVPQINVGYLKFVTVSKLKERRFFSGYTLFLISAYIVLRFFSLEVAIFSMLAFIFADLLAPAGKQVFLPLPLLKEKTVGGFLIVVATASLTGIFLRSLTGLPLNENFIAVGALTIAVLDQLSFLIDDNLLVPIGTAVILTLVF